MVTRSKSSLWYVTSCKISPFPIAHIPSFLQSSSLLALLTSQTPSSLSLPFLLPSSFSFLFLPMSRAHTLSLSFLSLSLGLGLTGVPVFNVNNNCSSGSTALMLARSLVVGGMDCVLAVGKFLQILLRGFNNCILHSCTLVVCN